MYRRFSTIAVVLGSLLASLAVSDFASGATRNARPRARKRPPPSAPTSQDLFRRYRDRVFQVRIVDKASSAQSSLGTGFFVSPDGLAVTNYHVVSELVLNPTQYRAELVREGAPPVPIAILDLDVVQDLALLKAETGTAYFEFQPDAPPKGTRLFSLGNPHDLGLSIVEGSYNGIVAESFYEKIHFTGAINSGMSGGPTIGADGRVVGVNVASSGNQIGFLVPASYAKRLLDQATSRDAATAEALMERVRTSLVESQDRVTTRLLESFSKTLELGPYVVPGDVDPALHCWGDTDRSKGQAYEEVSRYCASDDEIYLTGNHRTGLVWTYKQWFSTKDLNPVAFYKLYERAFNSIDTKIRAGREDVTPFRCRDGRVRSGDIDFETVFCARAYRRVAGLYDVLFAAASVDSSKNGLQTTLTLGGFSFENAREIARRYLEAVKWKN